MAARTLLWFLVANAAAGLFCTTRADQIEGVNRFTGTADTAPRKPSVAKSEWTVIRQAQSPDRLRISTVLIRNASGPRRADCYDCSGVCVSADGKVMSAKHCGFQKEVVILFSGIGEVPATKIYDYPQQTDGPIVFQITKKGTYPFVPVSSVKPEIGSKGRYFGFPNCKSLDQFIEGSGTFEGGTNSEVDGSKVNIISNTTDHGMSGGPIVNEAGELVGILHGGTKFQGQPNKSLWLSFASIREAWATVGNAPSAGQPSQAVGREHRLIAFVQPGERCPPCSTFEREAKSGLLGEQAKKAVIVKVINGRWMECSDETCRPTRLADEFQNATGVRLAETPVFWVEGTKSYRSGYPIEQCQRGYCGTGAGRNLFCGWLSGIWKGLGALAGGIAGQPAYYPEPPPGVPVVSPIISPPITTPPTGVIDLGKEEPGLEPIPDDTVPPLAPTDTILEPNWAAITVNIVAKKTDLGIAKGAGLRLLLNQGTGPAERKINDLLGGKAVVRIIAERTQPFKYSSVCSAAKISPDPIQILVTVGEKDLGLKGIIVKRVEEAVSEYIPDSVPIDLIFRRTHEDYALITQTLEASEEMSRENSVPSVPQEPPPGGGPGDGPQGGVGEAEDASLYAKIAAWMTSLLAGGGITWKVRDWLRKKKEALIPNRIRSILHRDSVDKSSAATQSPSAQQSATQSSVPVVTTHTTTSVQQASPEATRPLMPSQNPVGASHENFSPEIVQVTVADPDVGLYHRAMAMVAKTHQHGADVIEMIHSAVKQLRAQVRPPN